MTASPETDVSPFRAAYAPPDEPLVGALLDETALDPAAEANIDRRATGLIAAIRAADSAGGLEDFLREYGLGTAEGLALMALAEALLRVPDAATQDRLIEDKLEDGDWSRHAGHSDDWLVNAATWGLGLSSRIVGAGETPDDILGALVHRLGGPAVRTATRRAMRLLGHHFVLGETIGEALERAAETGDRHSFDMLGEGARTAADAIRYRDAYADAIEAVGRSAAGAGADRPGISVKLSALHPRYEPLQRARVLAELVPTLADLARAAAAHALNLTVDAEEADRLDLSLAVFAAVAADPALAGWDGFGLAVQAYQKRAPAVIDWLAGLAAALGRRFTVRLVKGAYWDTEIKRAQERGLDDYPVFTRKPATDLCFLACARRLLAARPLLQPQFATHNALTVATIVEMAGAAGGYEFQRLHGMGEDLYAALRTGHRDIACRVYAPVGGHRELLAYLVRRLLENGANASFVARAGDPAVPVADLLVRPAALLAGQPVRHPRIVLPCDLYRPERANSAGMEFGDPPALERLRRGMHAAGTWTEALPLTPVGLAGGGRGRPVVSPADGNTVVGTVVDAPEAMLDAVFASASTGFREWSAEPAEHRAAVLEAAADAIEADRDRLLALMALEGGKTLVDGLAEIREAADFCRYYAASARRLFASPHVLPGPTGEADTLAYRGRGVFVALSPWNFPLAIFTGQIAAALAAGNAVIAKPAEQTPLTACHAVRLLHRAGIPPSALHYLPGDGTLGAALVARPDVAGVVFTGATATAWHINRALAAKDGPIVPLIAETGGINAMIVDATALPEQVADDVVTSAFRSAGQRCSALRLLFVQDDVADRMLAMIAGAAAELRLGDPRDPATDLGPVIDGDARDAIAAHLAALDAAPWARVQRLTPVPAGGSFVAPHLAELDRPDRLTTEIFGPVLHVVRWRAEDFDDVLDAVAATGYGLTLGIHSRVDGTVARIVARLPVGNVYVNRSMIGAVVGSQPFGGSGLSGTGPKAGGPDYLRRFALEQVVSVNTAAAGGNASLITMKDA